MKNLFSFFVLAIAIAIGANAATAQTMTGPAAAKEKSKASKTAMPTIVDIAVGSKDHSTLVAAVQAAGLVETLKGAGPFTVFAPVNSAFDKLPAGTVDALLKPENKEMLTKVLTYHVVAGNLDSTAVAAAIKAGNGKVELTTVSGGKLWAMMDGGSVWLKDEKGNKAKVTAVDLKGSNGVIHVIDTIVMPN